MAIHKKDLSTVSLGLLDRFYAGDKNRMHAVLDPSRLNVTEKTRANLFSWRGQFTPQLWTTSLKLTQSLAKSF